MNDVNFGSCENGKERLIKVSDADLSTWSVDLGTVGGNVTYPKTGFALGATYKCNPKTVLKFKMSTNGNCAASAKQTIDSSTSICAAAAFDIKKPSEYKFGVIASLG
mgnify:CR=1 FL=1